MFDSYPQGKRALVLKTNRESSKQNKQREFESSNHKDAHLKQPLTHKIKGKKAVASGKEK